MKTVAIIQARMGSTRLPGKVMRTLCGKTILGHVLARVKAAKRLDTIVVATTAAEADQEIVEECRRWNVASFRGSEADVLARYHGAATVIQAETIVRITSDCPLYDPTLLDDMLIAFAAARRQNPPVDYLSNTQRRTYPRGLDTEIFTFAALDRAWHETAQPHEREHVTPYFYQHPERFRLQSYEAAADHSGLRWTLDTPEDWEFVAAIYAALGQTDSLFTTSDILRLLEQQPHLGKINAKIEQKKLEK
jgi:spore coat polysaccharide biosynthesis protein SpsF